MILSLQPKVPNYPVLFGLVSPKSKRMSESYHMAEVPPSASPMAEFSPSDIVDIMAAIPQTIQQTLLSSIGKVIVR